LKFLFHLTVFVVLCLFATNFAFGQIQFPGSNLSSGNKLFVSFENDIAPSYEVTLISNETYILSQSHSWVKDESSRYNLVAYSLDGSDFISIARVPRGVFTLDIVGDSFHSVEFKAVTQFPIAVGGSEVFFFSPESPTEDNWFDIGSDVSVVVPSIIDVEENKIRRILTGWSIDKGQVENIGISDIELFTTPPIKTSELHYVDFSTITEFKLDVISEYGTPEGDGWYEVGSEATVSIIPENEGLIRHVVESWVGSEIEVEGSSAKVTIRGPTLVQANMTEDYSLLIISIVVPVIALVFVSRKLKRKKPINVSVSKPQSEKEYVSQIYDFRYTSNISDLVKEKAMEKLKTIRDSNLISDSKYSKLVKKLG